LEIFGDTAMTDREPTAPEKLPRDSPSTEMTSSLSTQAMRNIEDRIYFVLKEGLAKMEERLA
jgi:hypothetical protein